MKVRTKGMGARATARTLEKSHSTILGWEKRLAQKSADWSPPAPSDKDITLEGDEHMNKEKAVLDVLPFPRLISPLKTRRFYGGFDNVKLICYN